MVVYFLIILAIVAALIVVYLILREVIGAVEGVARKFSSQEFAEDVASVATDIKETAEGFTEGFGVGVEWLWRESSIKKGWDYFFGSDPAPAPAPAAEEYEVYGPPLPEDYYTLSESPMP